MDEKEASIIPFGTHVRVSGRYTRIMEGQKRYWRAVGFRGTGIVIGKRTLWNGTAHYESYDNEYDGPGGYTYFKSSEHFTAYLVAFSDRNPVYVPMDCIKERKV